MSDRKRDAMKSRFPFFAYGFPLLFAAALFAQLAKAVEMDGIAATVGNETILRSDVFGEMRRAGAGEDGYARTLSRLIDRKLILKAAAESKMTLQEWVVENRIREIIDTSFDGDRNKLITLLGQQKVPYPEWRKRIRDDMIVGAMRWNMIDKYCVASPAMMKAEFAAHPARYALDAKTTVAVILLKPSDVQFKEAISEELKTGDFGEAARRYSSDTRAADGGVWKDVDANEVFRPEIADAIAQLAPGELSGWIDLDGWSFLVKKIGDSVAKNRTFAEAYDDIEANVKEELAKKAYTEWMDRLRSETYIKVW
ncbi:MAG: peptidyl-prolyl cis-trans isomerase [Kiritimatiellae bacterium]|nr:peptidyl-prolyl cis-trans isomerase [Kiritimatiellia bacterium]